MSAIFDQPSGRNSSHWNLWPLIILHPSMVLYNPLISHVSTRIYKRKPLIRLSVTIRTWLAELVGEQDNELSLMIWMLNNRLQLCGMSSSTTVLLISSFLFNRCLGYQFALKATSLQLVLPIFLRLKSAS